VKQDNDWKGKYQVTVKELDTKEGEWLALEEILRKAIGRLSIAGRGIDKSLDQQLKEIQQFSRQKQDQNLLQALDKLANIVAALDDDQPVKNAVSEFEPSSVLLDMLQGIQLEASKRADLKKLCADLLKSITSGAKQQSIEALVAQLSTLINSGIVPAEKTADLAQDILIQLVSLLELNDVSQQQITQQLDLKSELTPLELQSLASIINSQFSNEPGAREAAEDISIDSVISSLLERLAIVQGASAEIDKIQARIEKGIGGDDWPDTLSDIVDSVSSALQKLRDEKLELENFILAVTEQLGEITDVINADSEDRASGQKDTLSLQELLQKGIATMKDNVNNEQDIDQLKTIVESNIDSVRDGVESFVHRVNERHDATEVRNKKLSAKILQMEQKTKQLNQSLAENRKKLLYDTLTGVHSRLAYDEKIEQEFSRWKRYRSPFTYAILDIDHFKKVNDEYGHNAGDKALKIIAQLMQKQIRKSDTLCRIGGEEFVLFLTNTTAVQAEPLLTKLRNEVADSSFHFKQKRIQLTLSAGITESRTDDNVQSMYERADAALYRAKNAGRNCQFVD
jgi:diguanylate cyclase